MSWGSEQIYEVTKVKTLLNPPKNIKSIFCAVWMVLANLSLVASQDLFSVTSMLLLLLAFSSLYSPFSAVDQFHTDGGLCLFIPTPWPVHSVAFNRLIGLLLVSSSWFCNKLWGSNTVKNIFVLIVGHITLYHFKLKTGVDTGDCI